jgi:hypothetical protein
MLKFMATKQDELGSSGDSPVVRAFDVMDLPQFSGS